MELIATREVRVGLRILNPTSVERLRGERRRTGTVDRGCG